MISLPLLFGPVLYNASQNRFDNQRIDLTRFSDANPLLISDAATAAEARNLLRMTGARHVLAVYTRRGRVVGICTRGDLQPKAVEDSLHRIQ